MRRWNGWGDETIITPLPADGIEFLEKRVGPATPPQDVALADVTAAVPPSRLASARA